MRTYMYQGVVALLFVLLTATGVAAQEPNRELSPELRAQLEAQLAAEEQPTLIANVNFRAVSTSTDSGRVTVDFGLENTYGKQDGISYGVVFRSLANDELLASINSGEQLTLAEGEKRQLSFSYEVPTYLTQPASAVLSAYNREGLPLAFQIIDTVPASQSAVSCSNQNDTVTCAVPAEAEADLVIRSGSPQGEVVKSSVVTIDSDTGINLLEVVEALSPGRYVAQVSVRDIATKEVLGTYATDFTKPGEYGKLMSVSPLFTEEGKLEVIVYAEVGYYAGTEPLSVQVGLGDCADTQTLAFDQPVKTFVFDTTCGSGMVKAQFLVGDMVLDTVEVGFGTAADGESTPSSDGTGVATEAGQAGSGDSAGMLLSVVLIGVVILAGLTWYFYLRQPEPIKSPTDTQVPPLMLALLIMAGLSFTATVEAATFTIGGTPSYNICAAGTGISCAEPSDMPAPRTSGTVTVPDSVAQGDSYLVDYTISVTTPTPNTLCSNVACTASNTIVEVYDNLPALGFGSVGTHFVSFYNTLPAGRHGSTNNITRPLIHYKSQGTTGNFTRTAPLTGTQDVLTFLTQPGGATNPISSCTPTWCLTYPFSRRNVTVTLTAPNSAPTANAGSDRVITLPTNSVTISGASATDSDGTISSISWSGPAGIAISGGTTLTPTFSGFNTAGAGTYTFTLTVRDNAGATDTDTVSVSAFAAAPSCGWATTAYLGLNTGNPGMHNTTRCSTPAPSDGTPNNAYCDSAGENGTTVVCCDSGADCYRYTCNYGGSCTASVQLNFQ